MGNKYGAKKQTIDGITFDSQMEAKFYVHLTQLKKDGKIDDFFMQERFEIIPAYVRVDGKKIRKTEYVPDFTIYHTDGRIEYVDVKGVETDVFKIKRKLFEKIYQTRLTCTAFSRIDGGWIDLDDLKQARKERKKARGK